MYEQLLTKGRYLIRSLGRRSVSLCLHKRYVQRRPHRIIGLGLLQVKESSSVTRPLNVESQLSVVICNVADMFYDLSKSESR